MLEGVARRVRSGPWEGSLYRTRDGGSGASAPVRLIPYYTWNNRGRAEMSVWLPLF